MIAIAQPLANPPAAEASNDQDQAAWQSRFIELLPAVRRHAQVVFRRLPTGEREEAVAEVAAHAWLAFRRLAELGRLSLVFPTALARFSVARALDGRSVGNRRRRRELLSKRWQRGRACRVESLHGRDEDGGWKELVVEDRHAGPAQVARLRLDFASWLAALPERQREIAEALAVGHETQLVAAMFKVSPGRVSQLRKVLLESWLRHQGEPQLLRPSRACCA